MPRRIQINVLLEQPVSRSLQMLHKLIGVDLHIGIPHVSAHRVRTDSIGHAVSNLTIHNNINKTKNQVLLFATVVGMKVILHVVALFLYALIARNLAISHQNVIIKVIKVQFRTNHKIRKNVLTVVNRDIVLTHVLLVSDVVDLAIVL